MRTPLLLPTLVLAGLALTACTDASTPAPPEATGAPSSQAPAAVGPLQEYLGVGNREAGGDDALDLRIEEELARCMAAEGFEYVPYVDTSFDATVTADGQVLMKPADFPDLPPDEFAAQFGYGISTKDLGAERSAAQKNPNDAIVARMSVAQRVAYHQAFYGKQIALDDQGYLAGTSISNSDSSCSGRAYALEPTDKERARSEKRITRVQESFASLLDRVRALREEQDRDPRVSAATATWGTCLAAAGHPGFTALDQPRAHVRKLAQGVLGPDLDGTADAARLADLRAVEIALAVADTTCLEAWRMTYDVVQRDLEEAFVRENLAELEAFRSAMAAAVADQD